MKATEKPILKFLEGPKQFFVPIFQRRYSWEQKNCYQLWTDVLNAGEDEKMQWHFLGSIVYLEPEVQNTGSLSEYLVIDGQQRLTTLSLLLLALSRSIKEEDNDIGITPNQISNYYLFNNEVESEELHHKLRLTKGDNETFDYLLKTKELLPQNPSSFLVKNYRFFEKMLKDVVKGNITDEDGNSRDVSLKTVYTGLNKLMIIDIILERNENNPQKIFESLNSTGVPLSQADLIRNYVLLGQEAHFQNRLYKEYWFPMEQYFGNEYRKRFDSFMRDYLTLKTERISARKDIYVKFKAHLPDYMFKNPENAEKIVSSISRYGSHYVDISQKEEDPELRTCLEDIRELRAEVAYPFLLEVYDYYKRGEIEKSEVIETLQLVESYVFRRSICELSGKFLNHTFVKILKKMSLKEMSKKNIKDYIKSFNDTLLSMPSISRFPKDDEFKRALLQKDIYTAQSGRICKYMLRKLENYGHKEPINVDDYTIEHVMPQKLTIEWQEELGKNYSETHYNLLHTIGNLTLTGYNTEYSNSHFKEKRDMEKGFRQSHLYLNESLACAEQWNLSSILARAKELAEKSCEIWIYPEGDGLKEDINNSSIKKIYDYQTAQTKYNTSSDSTSMADWSKWEQELGWIIIEMLEYTDPSGLMIFEPRDIQDYYPRLKKMWPDNNSIDQTVGKMLASLVNRGELEKPNRGEYRLVEGELLHLHLKRRIIEKELTKNKQESDELEDELTE